MYRDFEKWEASFEPDSLPELPPNLFEKIVENSSDPIVCARAMQHFIKDASPEVQEMYVREGVDLIGLRYNYDFINTLVDVRLEGRVDTPHLPYVASEMQSAIQTLETQGYLRAGGQMSYMEKHFYTDPSTDITRPILSLRLFNSAYLNQDNEKVGVPGFMTIPVTAITGYRIIDAFR